jgi:hypothetical protein
LRLHFLGAQPPYSNALSTVSVQQKHQNRNANLKKRKMKIKKSENHQRKVENRDRKRELKREGISKQFKPLALSKKCNLNRTNLKRLNTQNLGKKVQKKEVKYLIDRKGKYQYLRRRKTTGIGQSSVPYLFCLLPYLYCHVRLCVQLPTTWQPFH